MKIIKNKLSFVCLILIGLFFLLTAGIILNNISTLPSQLILHFDSFNGINMFGGHIDLWVIWIMSFVFILMNIILAEEFFKKDKIFAYILLSADILISIFTLIITSTIISVS